MMINRLLMCFFVLSLAAFGCLGGKSEKVAEQTATQTEPTEPQTVAELHLSLSKPAYSVGEAIPVEMTIQLGKFDLLVPFVTTNGKGAFTKLILKDAKGQIVQPRHPITMAGEMKDLIHKGKQVRCIHGVELKAEKQSKAILEDLSAHYKLAPGDYTLSVSMELEVYRESLADQSPQIIELEQEIASIQRNPNLPADAKTEAASRLREEITYWQNTERGKSDRIYLPVSSRRGSAELESNVIALKIESGQ